MPNTHNPIVLIDPTDREAANAAMVEIYDLPVVDVGETFRGLRGVGVGGVAPITLLYAAPGLTDAQFAALEAKWALDFPTGIILDATVEDCMVVFEAWLTSQGLWIVEPEI